MVHRKTVRHFHEVGHLHELTFSCYRRMPLLTNNDWRTRLSAHVDQAGKEASFDLVAFVYMPEHVHILMGGRIVLSGGPELALELEERGYDWVKEERA